MGLGKAFMEELRRYNDGNGGMSRQDLVNELLVAVAQESTPSTRPSLPAQVSPGFADAVQCVEKYRDDSQKQADDWGIGSYENRTAELSRVAAANEIIAALKALTQPAVADEKAGEPNCECGYPHDFDNPYK